MVKSDRFNWLMLFCIAALGVAADQASKYGVFSWLAKAPENRFVLFRTTPETEPDLQGFAIAIQYERSDDVDHRVLTYPDGSPVPHVNHGALFGFLRDHKTTANRLFMGASLAAIAFILWWSRQPGTTKDRWLCAALGFILAGTFGNLYDRVVFNGVRDFLHWDYLYNWPVFNLADCFLVTGACMLLVQALGFRMANNSADVKPPSNVQSARSSEALLAPAGSSTR
jgi:lipoprotein signal peptidase